MCSLGCFGFCNPRLFKSWDYLNLSLGRFGFCDPRLFKSWDYLNPPLKSLDYHNLKGIGFKSPTVKLRINSAVKFAVGHVKCTQNTKSAIALHKSDKKSFYKKQKITPSYIELEISRLKTDSLMTLIMVKYDQDKSAIGCFDAFLAEIS